ncbi:Protein kinase dsk1 [Beauveria bassiana D1-5]|uniref:non-specific serine/threonine protein kinase n=1 Tax=Beauveria bassiana D1-5 TaxID=1245745 RepID=A0A0A2VIR2_BEABA|nr:Protein kinase dsk1 [Beauveria bassiana D1-5]
MVKIGFGAFSTVWLARDLDENRWVAVKICCGIEAPQRSSEASILSEIRETCQGKAGVEQVLQLFDDFIIKGPNGFHECLITEVVAPLTYSAVRERCSIDAEVNSMADPHISNLGVALPQLQELGEQDMADLFPTEKPFPVMSRHERKPLANLPAFMVALESLAHMLEEQKLFPGGKKLQIKILDFGRDFSRHIGSTLVGKLVWLRRAPHWVPGPGRFPHRVVAGLCKIRAQSRTRP